MPSVRVHCGISKQRTGQDFSELHRWIDEPRKWLKYNHRIERHSYTKDYEDYIRDKWGDKAVVEWLFHIALDNLETANKFAVNTYPEAFDEINIYFLNKEIAKCKFSRFSGNTRNYKTFNPYK